MNITLWNNGRKYQLELEEERAGFVRIKLNGREYRVKGERIKDKEWLLWINGRVYDVIVQSNRGTYTVYLNGYCLEFKKDTSARLLGRSEFQVTKKDVVTSMPGKIVKVLVKEGDEVEKGQPVVILEAMKMQNAIKSPKKGRIVRLPPKAGDSVEAGALLFSVE
ncbi:MAG: biotin/lipoyl-binding protein [Candidatus Aminicenantes bacterium]|nr:biotin/lipoyl-binding protein [Candidatus Aminicenantes bacterium]